MADIGERVGVIKKMKQRQWFGAMHSLFGPQDSKQMANLGERVGVIKTKKQQQRLGNAFSDSPFGPQDRKLIQ